MAKELPYFKFEPSEWNDGDITLCSMEAQGLFINLCSLYWSKVGVLSYTKALRRYNECNATAWESLIDEGILIVKDDQIIIKFLDEQFKERKILSDKNRSNALEMWKKKRAQSDNDATAPKLHAIKKRKEESKEEEKRENKQLTKDVCDFFSVNEMKNMSAFKMLNAFVSVSGIDTTAFNAYKEYKHTTGDKIHGWQSFIGSREKGFEDGAWCSCDWSAKIKDIPQQSNGIPSEPDLTWIATKGKDIQLYQSAAKKWRENGWEYIQPPGSTKRIWREIKQ